MKITLDKALFEKAVIEKELANPNPVFLLDREAAKRYRGKINDYL